LFCNVGLADRVLRGIHSVMRAALVQVRRRRRHPRHSRHRACAQTVIASEFALPKPAVPRVISAATSTLKNECV
jgi:hypothetical protein